MRYLATSLVLPFLATLGLIAIGATLVYVQGIAPQAPPHFDEAAHALVALQMTDDLAHGDALALAFDSYRQVVWPPLHAWTTGLVFLLWGPSRDAGRLLSLAAYAALGLALYALGHEVGVSAGAGRRTTGAGIPGDEIESAGIPGAGYWAPAAGNPSAPVVRRPPAGSARGRWCGVLAAAFALAAPLTRGLAAQARPELLGALILTLGLWAYLRAAGRVEAPGSTRRWATVGLCIVLAYLARVQFGLLLLAVVALDRLFATGGRPRALLERAHLRANAAWLAPVAAFVLVWFAYPPKAVAALNWIGRAANHPLGPQSPGLANALYYPTVALPASAGSWLHVLYLALGFCFSLPYWRERALRVFVGLALLTFVPALWTTNHQMRYILPLLLALDVLAAFWIAVGFERVAALRQRATAAAVAVLVLVLLLGFAVPPERTDLVPAYAPPLDEMLAYFDKQAREVGPVLLLGAPDAGFGADHLFLDWHAIVEARLIPLNGSGVLYSPWTPERAVPVETLRRLGMPPAALDDLAQLQRRGAAPDPPGSSRALWIAIAGDALQPRTPDELRVQLEPTLGVYQPRRVVAVGDQSRVALYTPAFLEAALEGTGYTLVTTREFPEVKVTVLTFDR